MINLGCCWACNAYIRTGRYGCMCLGMTRRVRAALCAHNTRGNGYYGERNMLIMKPRFLIDETRPRILDHSIYMYTSATAIVAQRSLTPPFLARECGAASTRM
jgi:hypothetical protein